MYVGCGRVAVLLSTWCPVSLVAACNSASCRCVETQTKQRNGCSFSSQTCSSTPGLTWGHQGTYACMYVCMLSQGLACMYVSTHLWAHCTSLFSPLLPPPPVRTYECRCVLPLLHSTVCLVLGDVHGPGALFRVRPMRTDWHC